MHLPLCVCRGAAAKPGNCSSALKRRQHPHLGDILTACAGCRYARQTLEIGGSADAMLDSADTVYVYDYCYIMRQAADSNAQRHWLLKDSYNGTRGKGVELLKLYRCAASPLQMQGAPMQDAHDPSKGGELHNSLLCDHGACLPTLYTLSFRVRLSPVVPLWCCKERL